MLRSLIAAAAAAALSLAAVGCTSGHPHQDASAAATAGTGEQRAVACDKCRTVFAESPVRSGKGGAVTSYVPSKQMVCPDCRGMADTFFRTGKLEHSCNACKGTMQTCDVH